MILLSFSGTFRLILILLIVLMILRMLARSGKGNGGGGSNWGKPEDRPKGEVRIERAGDEQRRGHGTVEDADFEEVK